MKKLLIFFSLIIIGVFLVACSKNGQGTYYPNSDEMQYNLENKNYKVNVQTIKQDEYSGTCLMAEKDGEYIEFYWLNSSEGVNSIEQELKTKYTNYAKLVSMEDDSKFGSFVFCSSEKAMDDSGIEIVDVKVNVK